MAGWARPLTREHPVAGTAGRPGQPSSATLCAPGTQPPGIVSDRARRTGRRRRADDLHVPRCPAEGLGRAPAEGTAASTRHPPAGNRRPDAGADQSGQRARHAGAGRPPDLAGRRLARIGAVQDGRRHVWALTARGHREARQRSSAVAVPSVFGVAVTATRTVQHWWAARPVAALTWQNALSCLAEGRAGFALVPAARTYCPALRARLIWRVCGCR